MKNALCMIRMDPHYRREAFLAGLRKAGFRLIEKGLAQGPDDFLIVWNRYGANGSMADSWERAGGTVLVAENGYIGRDANGHQLYALSIHGHNGSGRWPSGDGSRFAALDIELQPWIKREGYSLVCGQRGIGTPKMASPPDWHKVAARRIEKQGHAVKIRLHPGNHEATVPLESDLMGARNCVIWSSSSGVKSLVHGIPVRFDAPCWICSTAAKRIDDAEDCYDDALRLEAMQRMAWAQWSIAELESGEPFARLLELAARAPA